MSDWIVTLRRWEKLIAKRTASTVGEAARAFSATSLAVRCGSVTGDAMVTRKAIQAGVARETESRRRFADDTRLVRCHFRGNARAPNERFHLRSRANFAGRARES